MKPRVRKFIMAASALVVASTAFGVASTAYGAASAQIAVAQTQTFDSDIRTDLGSALRVVRPLVRDDPARAVQMLERLAKEYPTQSQVFLLLGETYQGMGNTELARSAYERCLKQEPTHQQAGAALGTLLVQAGDRAKGDAVFRQLLERTEYGVSTYRTIGSTLSRNGLFDLALAYYNEGRKRNGDNYILTLDVAYLERSMGDYEGALEEYLSLVETTPRQSRLAEARIAELIDDPNAPDDLIEILERDAARQPARRRVVQSVLANAYLKRGQLEFAFESALQADEDKSGDGGVLFELAKQTTDLYNALPVLSTDRARYFDLSLRALEAFLGGYPAAAQLPAAKLMLIDLLVDLASGKVKGNPSVPPATAVEQAVSALDWIIASFPETDYAEQAYLKKGDVVFYIRRQPEKSLDIYKTGMTHARFHRAEFAERLGHVYLVVENYDEAENHFTTLARSGNAELHEAGSYYLGLLRGFKGDYEAARDTLTALAEANPSSPYTNDAIEFAWAIEEGLQGDQRNLKHYVTAMRSEMAGDTATVVRELAAITAGPADTPLRSRSLFKLGEVYAGMGRYEPAIGAYQQFISDYPKDTQVPDAHRRIGQVYEVGYHKLQEALDCYEHILLAFPHYIFLDDVRKDVTRVREELKNTHES